MSKQISEKRLEDINNRHVYAVDKWFRMFAGFSSSLKDYRDDIVFLEVRNTERKFKSDSDLAARVIRSWEGFTVKRKLRTAVAYVVFVYSTRQSTGFVVPTDSEEVLVEGMVREMALEERIRLVGVFSSMREGA